MEYEVVKDVADRFEVSAEKLMAAYERCALKHGYVCCPLDTLRVEAIKLRPSGMMVGNIGLISPATDRKAGTAYDDVQSVNSGEWVSLPEKYMADVRHKMLG